jgi:hypothetical protein
MRNRYCDIGATDVPSVGVCGGGTAVAVSFAFVQDGPDADRQRPRWRMLDEMKRIERMVREYAANNG